ncbi:MAG: LysM peptidoglycan-binding domain-containing protein [Chthoniobacterales bacterium]|nr:LysM peptidoglycan-binding domain-containing protein [Chthoniobacterales bacterium]
MKLSRALLIVLVLHVVAVAGIIAFNTIKTREAFTAEASAPPLPKVMTEPPEVAPAAAPQIAARPEPAAPNEIKKSTAQPETKAAAKPFEHPKAEAKASSVPDSGEIYTVVKGDNPVTIARHLHVSYDALLELNLITDPRKLQIGQKLHIPAPTTAKHKSD